MSLDTCVNGVPVGVWRKEPFSNVYVDRKLGGLVWSDRSTSVNFQYTSSLFSR